MRWAVLVSAALWACAPSNGSEDPLRVRALRQAGHVPMGVVEEGPSGSLLGSTLVKCPGGGFVSGAPGTGTAWHSSGAFPNPVGEGLGRAIACIPAGAGGASSSEMLAGGDGGVRKAVIGSWSIPLGVGIVLSMSSSDDPQLPLIVGYENAVAFADANTGTQIGTLLSGANGYGAVVQWYPSQPRFAATHALGSLVAVYDYSIASAGVVSVPTVVSRNTPGFGRALAVGNVLPAAGDELIIGANGAVFVYLNDASGPVMQLSGTEASFGASLAIAPGPRGLDRLLVGQPSNDSVYLFIGDAGAVYVSGPIAGESFGASVAVSQGELAIGAPNHASGSGAVYREPILLPSPDGEMGECQVGRACFDQQCNQGVCVGGVFCDTSVPIVSSCTVCLNGQCTDPNFDGGSRLDAGVDIDDGGALFDAGVRVDAGLPVDAGSLVDAGALDASVEVDAGSRDAGLVEPDAGSSDGGADAGREERDAGVKPPKDAGVDAEIDSMIFTTSGCSESGALPLLALCLAMLRRRAR